MTGTETRRWGRRPVAGSPRKLAGFDRLGSRRSGGVSDAERVEAIKAGLITTARRYLTDTQPAERFAVP